MEIFSNVKTLADKKGYSIAYVEKSAGLSNGTIGKWRTARKGITLESVLRVAEVLDVNIQDLIFSGTKQEV